MKVVDQVVKLEMEDIYLDNDFNCRDEIIPAETIDLAKDIKERGLIAPIVVSLQTEEGQKSTGKKYIVRAGHRRTKAHMILKKTTIHAIIKEFDSEKDAVLFNIAENLNRRDLNIMEEAKVCLKLLEMNMSEVEIGEKLNKGRGWAQTRLLLMKLPEEIQEDAKLGTLKTPQIRQVYTVFKARGKEAAFEKVKKFKEAKRDGKIIQIANKQSSQGKRQRKRPEILTLMYHIQEYLPNGLYTRVLAWAAGEVSDDELHESLQQFAEKNNLDYKRPSL